MKNPLTLNEIQDLAKQDIAYKYLSGIGKINFETGYISGYVLAYKNIANEIKNDLELIKNRNVN